MNVEKREEERKEERKGERRDCVTSNKNETIEFDGIGTPSTATSIFPPLQSIPLTNLIISFLI
jgi:hypothetical protein